MINAVSFLANKVVNSDPNPKQPVKTNFSHPTNLNALNKDTVSFSGRLDNVIEEVTTHLKVALAKASPNLADIPLFIYRLDVNQPPRPDKVLLSIFTEPEEIETRFQEQLAKYNDYLQGKIKPDYWFYVGVDGQVSKTVEIKNMTDLDKTLKEHRPVSVHIFDKADKNVTIGKLLQDDEMDFEEIFKNGGKVLIDINDVAQASGKTLKEAIAGFIDLIQGSTLSYHQKPSVANNYEYSAYRKLPEKIEF